MPSPPTQAYPRPLGPAGTRRNSAFARAHLPCTLQCASGALDLDHLLVLLQRTGLALALAPTPARTHDQQRHEASEQHHHGRRGCNGHRHDVSVKIADITRVRDPAVAR
jgi:hypothetical protein